MAEENIDANTGEDFTEDTDSSSDVEYEPIVDEEGLVSTTEYQVVEHDDEEADSDEDTPDDAGQNTSEADASKQDFHEHPRFKELVEEKNRYKAELDASKRQRSPEQTPSPKYENVMAWEDDKIVDEIANNPKGFLTKFAQQMYHEFQGQNTRAQQEHQQQTVKQQSLQNMQSFFSERADGQDMLKDGRIKQFIADNPGHNAISAYHSLTEDARIEKARAEERKKVMKELKRKGNARSFSSTPASTRTPTAKSPEMQNPDKHGGPKAVLVRRMEKRMAAEG